MPTKWYQRSGEALPQGRSRAHLSPFLVISVLLVLIVVSYRGWLPLFAQVLVAEDPPAPADAILILGGGAGSRQLRALALYREGLAPWLISSGEAPHLPDFARSFADIGTDFLVARGVAREAILLLPDTTSTRDEATASLALAQERGFRSLLVVTDDYHTGRSRLTFRRAFRGSGIEVRMVGVHPPWFQTASWWSEERPLLAVIGEYEKLVFYLLKGYLF
jgi:uncharacterized SAM-binding protein YcdF (DUF218 family)